LGWGTVAADCTLVPDVDCDLSLLPYLPMFRAEGIAALAIIPLQCGGQNVGQLALYYGRPYVPTHSELEFVRAIGDHLGAAIARFACRAELTQRVQLGRLFAGILGRDLRNQLAPILMGAQLAAARADSDSLLQPLTTVLRSGERMVRMIDQLLDLSQIQVGSGLVLSPTRLDLLGLVRQVVDELDDANPDWLLSLEALGGETEGQWDADRLSSAFSNLLANAVEHGCSDHGVQVRIDGRDGRMVCVEVRNRGVIRPALVPKLFEPLTDGDRGAGLGLGLHITREFVRAHGGEIEVQSSDDLGTVFRVSLPRDMRRSGADVSQLSAQN